MTENVEIQITSDLDTKGLDSLRKMLIEQRNELAAVGKETDKTTQSYQNLKATTQELNRLTNLSNKDLKTYASSLVEVGKQTDVAEIKTGKLGKAISVTTKTFSHILGATTGLIGGLGTLTPLVAESGSSFEKTAAKIQDYSIAVIGVSSAISGLKYLMPVMSAATLITSALGVAFGAAATAFIVFKETLGNINISEGVGNLILLKNGISNPKPPKIDDGSFIRTPEQRFQDIMDAQKRREQEAGIYGSEMGPGNQSGKNTFNLEMMKSLGKGANAKKEQEKIETIVFDSIEEMIKKLFGGNTLSLHSMETVDRIKLGMMGKIGDMNAVGLPTEFGDKFQRGFFGVPKTIDTTGEQVNQALNDTNTMFNVVSQSMNLLGVSTNSFVGQLVGGFNTVLEIMQLIKTVNSIFNFLPLAAEGGTFSTPFIAGEAGAELIVPGGNSARVYKNSDTMKIMNNFNSNSNPHIYISSNINPEYINFVVGKKNAMEVYTRR